MTNDPVELLSRCLPLFNAFADASRQAIALLFLRQQTELGVNEIVARVQLSQPTVSHHLKILKDAGFIQVRRQGASRMYRIDGKHAIQPLKELLSAMESCPGWPEK